LREFKWDFRGYPIDMQHLEPIYLVGLNGSGKSNLIEALSEVFCYLELHTLGYVLQTQLKKVCPPPFSIEYLLHVSSKDEILHIKVELSDKKKISLFKKIEDDFENIENVSDWREYLPSNVVGYSYGHNETISIPYLRNHSLYSIAVAGQARAKGEKKKKVIQHTSSIYMDYDSNASILIANYLFLKNKDLLIFEDFLRI
jgi:predicted ATP-binding protein involved in virulence